jgi:hypothetical protein
MYSEDDTKKWMFDKNPVMHTQEPGVYILESLKFKNISDGSIIALKPKEALEILMPLVFSELASKSSANNLAKILSKKEYKEPVQKEHKEITSVYTHKEHVFLKAGEVREIEELLNVGADRESIAREYNTSLPVISRIFNGQHRHSSVGFSAR